MDFSKTEALHILQISKVDDAEDAYEELLFNWKQKYLSVIPPLKLIQAHLKKIERLNSAASVLLSINRHEAITVQPINAKLDLIDYLAAYQHLIMHLKLKISGTENGYELIALLSHLIDVQKALVNKLSAYAPKNYLDYLENVKISSPSDLYLAQKELLSQEIEETEIINYLSAKLITPKTPLESALLKEVLKALKQVE